MSMLEKTIALQARDFEFESYGAQQYLGGIYFHFCFLLFYVLMVVKKNVHRDTEPMLKITFTKMEII